MKRTIILIAIIAMTAVMVFADGHMSFGALEGDWSAEGRRLFQKDAGAPRAKAWVAIPQSGSMIYEFTIRYEGGAEDGHGGVGIHILADSIFRGKSWGMGDSWLLWLNYDVAPYTDGVPPGLSAQVYKSRSNSSMEIIKTVSLRSFELMLLNNLDSDIPMKLTFLADRGRIMIADPRGESDGWYLDLPGAAGEGGRYVAVRTNGVKVSFTSPEVDL